MQAAEQSNVLRFPTKRRRAYRNPTVGARELPPNAVFLREPLAPKQIERSAEMTIVCGILCALPPAQRRRVMRGVLALSRIYPTEGAPNEAYDWLNRVEEVLSGH